MENPGYAYSNIRPRLVLLVSTRIVFPYFPGCPGFAPCCPASRQD